MQEEAYSFKQWLELIFSSLLEGACEVSDFNDWRFLKKMSKGNNNFSNYYNYIIFYDINMNRY